MLGQTCHQYQKRVTFESAGHHTSDTDINEALTFRDCRFVRGLDRFTTG